MEIIILAIVLIITFIVYVIKHYGKFILCYGVAWCMVHGVEYIIGLIGWITGSKIMLSIFTSIYVFTSLPFCCENVVFTIPIALGLQKKIFPQDTDLQESIEQMK